MGDRGGGRGAKDQGQESNPGRCDPGHHQVLGFESGDLKVVDRTHLSSTFMLCF
jgi:hypothetical protein